MSQKYFLLAVLCFFSYSLPNFLVPHIPTVSLPFCFSVFCYALCLYFSPPPSSGCRGASGSGSVLGSVATLMVLLQLCVFGVSPAIRVCVDWSDRTRTPLHLTHLGRDSAMLTHGSLYKHTFLMPVLFTLVYQKCYRYCKYFKIYHGTNLCTIVFTWYFKYALDTKKYHVFWICTMVLL